MDYELLEKAAMTKYEMSKKDPFRFFIRSIVAGLYLGLADHFILYIGSFTCRTPCNCG